MSLLKTLFYFGFTALVAFNTFAVVFVIMNSIRAFDSVFLGIAFVWGLRLIMKK